MFLSAPGSVGDTPQDKVRLRQGLGGASHFPTICSPLPSLSLETLWCWGLVSALISAPRVPGAPLEEGVLNTMWATSFPVLTLPPRLQGLKTIHTLQ